MGIYRITLGQTLMCFGGSPLHRLQHKHPAPIDSSRRLAEQNDAKHFGSTLSPHIMGGTMQSAKGQLGPVETVLHSIPSHPPGHTFLLVYVSTLRTELQALPLSTYA